MSTIPVTDPHKAWNIKQFKRLEAYNARLQKLLDNAINKAASIAMRHDANASDEHLFSFSDDKQMKAEANKLMKDLSDEITSFTQSAKGDEWEIASQQATEYIGQIYNLAEQTQNRQDSFLDMMLGMRSRNEDALIEFNKRKIGGLNLSKKVWGYTQDFERQLEVSIDTALMQGMSASNLALSIQSLLKDPDDLFRRVRDKNDQLRLSKAMKAYHPGTGKYRSAYKNALRLARSEINIAYRTSDSNMAQMLDCVVGIQINLSNNHTNNGEPFTDICDQLAGKYPKDFKFVGWHPQCRCFITYILKSDDEFWEDLENGENNESVNTVKDVPDNFKEWVKDNEERIAKAKQKGTEPYFLKDNEQYLKSPSYIVENFAIQSSCIQKLRDLGYSVDNSSKGVKESCMKNFDFEQYHKIIDDELSKYGAVFKYGSISYGWKTTFDVTYSYNGEEIIIKREFYRKLDDTANRSKKYMTVTNAYFKLPASLQGNGISKRLFSKFHTAYKQIGVERMELYANIDVGGYCWAKYGFSCKYKTDIENIITFQEKEHKRGFDAASEIVKKYYSSHEDFEPFPMNLLTGYDWSKELLLNTSWDGVLYFEDTDRLAIFEKYLHI